MRGRGSHHRWNRLAVSTVLLAFGNLLVGLAMPAQLAHATPPPPMATEVNPDTVTPASSLKYGGRIESLAINPVNPDIVLAASELGGLWRSSDGGDTWSHVDALPLTRMFDVQFAAADSSLVIATGNNDGASPSRGGIWRSTDGGATWSRPATGVNGASCGNPAPGAHWLGIAGTTVGQLTIAVGTDCGISVSSDSGATWNQRFAAGPANAGYWDAEARVVSGQVQIDACGNGGFTRSTDGGATFSNFAVDATNLTGANGAVLQGPCRVAVAPNDANTVFVSGFRSLPSGSSGCGSQLLMATDANTATPTWTDLNACADNTQNGRFPYVQTHPDHTNPTTQFQVYFGNNTRTNVQTCTYTPTTCAPGPGTFGSGASGWPLYDGSNPHNGTDPTGVWFDPTTPGGCPVFLTGDGGVSRPDDCSTNPGSWTYPDTGLNALDAINIAGTVYSGHTSVYFGTQDNGIFWSTNDASAYNRQQYDIYGLLADHTGTGGNGQVVWRNGAYNPPPTNHVNISNNEDLSGSSGFTLPPGNNPGDNYSATQFTNSGYGFITPDIAPGGPTPPNWRMYVTTNDGGAWTQMGGNAPGAPVGNPAAAFVGGKPVFYVLLKVGAATKLYRLQGPVDNTATWTDVTSNLSNPTTFTVHPANSLLLYANDAGANKVMKSVNGGASWTADDNLTTLATRGGTFPFNQGGSQIAAFAFDANSNTVMAGANNSGVFASTDGGASWFSVTGAENLPRIAGFFFDEGGHRVYIASGGRGMWRIEFPTADLGLTKYGSPNPVIAGQQLTYTLTATNHSASATAGLVQVTDDLPPEVTYLTSSVPCTEGPPGHLVCTLPDIAGNSSYVFTITTLVKSNTVLNTGGAKTITNTASIASGNSADPDLSNNTATATNTVVDSADLRVTKICKPDTTIYAGTPINCTVFVDNLGPSDARNVVVDDTLLSNGTPSPSITNVSPAGCTVSAVTGGQRISCALGNLAAASSTSTGRATLTYTVTATEGQDLNNVASVRSDTPDPNASNNSATVNLTVTSVADLSIAKTAPSSAVAGQSVSWTLQVSNNNGGPSTAKNVVITDTVPAGVTVTDVTMAGASCLAGVAGDPLRPTTCTFGSLAPGALSNIMTVTALVAPQTTGSLVNDAKVSSATFDNNSSNDLVHTSTPVQVTPDLVVTVSDTPDPVTAGTALSYRVQVANNGPSTATGVSFTDTLPSSLTFTSTGGSGTCGFQTNTNTVTCQLPNLDPGQNTVVFIYTMVKSSVTTTPISNTATATSNGTDVNPSDNSGSASTAVATSADLALVLTSDKLVYKPSTTIHYQITVTNNGPSDAANVVYSQTLPGPKIGKYVSNNLGCPAPSGTSFTCQLPPTGTTPGVIPAGGSVTFQLNFYIQGNKQTITQTGTVTSSTSDPATANNSSTRVVTVK